MQPVSPCRALIEHVEAIPPSLPGPERHGAAAVGAKADAGKEGRATDQTRRRDPRIAGVQMCLHGIERRLIDKRRHVDGDDFAGRLQRVVLAAADIGRPPQDAVNLPDSPTSAVAGEDAVAVEIGRDVLDAHRAGLAIAFQGQPIDQPDGIRVERTDLQPLLDLRAALLGRHHAVTDGRQRAVPEALPSVLLQGTEHVLGILLGLVLVEQRYDLPHHDVHGIVTARGVSAPAKIAN